MTGLLLIREPVAADFVGTDDVEPEGAGDFGDPGGKVLVEVDAH